MSAEGKMADQPRMQTFSFVLLVAAYLRHVNATAAACRRCLPTVLPATLTHCISHSACSLSSLLNLLRIPLCPQLELLTQPDEQVGAWHLWLPLPLPPHNL